MSGTTSLPDDLLAAQECAEVGKHFDTGLLARASERICALEEEVLRLRGSIASHRASNDFSGERRPCDELLYRRIADVPWGKAIKGDG